MILSHTCASSLQAPSIVGFPTRRDVGGVDVHVLGAVAQTDAEGLVLSLADLDELDSLRKVTDAVKPCCSGR